MMQEQHRATARVLDILELLASTGEHGYTLTELAAALDAPKSSLFPIIHTLLNRKYLQLDKSTGRYSVGIGTYVLGAGFSAGRSTLDLILKVMEAAVDHCEETCQLGVLDREQVLYIEKVDSPQAIRMISRVGNRLPANGTAIGKALLSGLSDEAVAALFSEGLPRLTSHTIADLGVLLTQLGEVRRTGIAREREESTDQLCCWAVPLRRSGAVFAALSVSVPLFRCTAEKERQVLDSLKKAQGEIERIAESRNFSLEAL